MDSLSRLEELVDEQGYSLRSALAQLNIETGKSTAVFDGEVAEYTNDGDVAINASKVLIVFLDHKVFP